MRKRWTAADDAYIDQRRQAGASYAVIARELGVTSGAIAGRFDRRRSSLDQPSPALQRVPEALDPRVTQEGCRWVEGTLPKHWHWCGQPISEGAYCAKHAARSKHPIRGDEGR